MQRRIRWIRGVSQYRLSGRNIFNLIPDSSNFVAKISQAYADIWHILYFNSTVLENFLDAASIQDTRRNFRSSLKIIFFTIWGALYETTLHVGAFDMYYMNAVMILLISVVLLYIHTYNEYGHLWYSRMSYALLTIVFLFAVLNSSETIVKWTSIIPFVKLFICLCIFLPVRLDLTLTLVSLFSISFQSIVNHQYSFVVCEKLKNYSTKHHDTHRHSHSDFTVSLLDCQFLKNFGAKLSLQLIMCSVLLAAGVHLQFWNKIRRRAAFIKIGQSVHLQKQNRKAQHLNERLIETRMPLRVYHEYTNQMNHVHQLSGKPCYIRPNNAISILVVEITNFRQINLKNSASKVIRSLSTVVDRFDQLAIKHMCERLSTFVNQFIYTSGIIKTRINHARCCVELATEMMRLANYVSLDVFSHLEFRIGIHTGEGVLVIWTNDMLPFDILTPDILIAHQVKDFASAGQIIISQSSHSRVQQYFTDQSVGHIRLDPQIPVSGSEVESNNFNPRILKVYRIITSDEDTLQFSSSFHSDEELGLLGQVVKLVEQNQQHNREQVSLINCGQSMFTPPLMPHLSVFSFARKSMNSVDPKTKPTIRSRWNAGLNDAEEFSKHNDIDVQVLRLVTELRADPKHQISLMQSVPLCRWTNLFRNPELEWHYSNHVNDASYPVYTDSLKLAPAVDAIALLFTTIATIIFSIIFTEHTKHQLIWFVYVGEFVFAAAISSSVVWSATRFSTLLTIKVFQQLHEFLSRSITVRMNLFILILLPTVHAVCYSILAHPTGKTGDRFYGAMVSFRMIAVVNHMMATTSPFWMICFGIMVNFVVYLVIHQSFIHATLHHNSACMPDQAVHEVEIFITGYILDVFTSFVMIWIMGRVNDRNCRLNFLCMRELQICREESDRCINQLHQSLGQLLPNHVVRFILDQRIKRSAKYCECCSTTLNNIGVATLHISNLYQRSAVLKTEDWHHTLRVLNLVMCALDELMKDNKYFELSYVRNANCQLVIASGLEQFSVWSNDDTYHLDRLLEYCLAAQQIVHDLNREHLRDIPQLHLKIGYTRGAVNTGIVGSKRPFYAVWGLPVQIATRIAESGRTGDVLTTADCTDLISSQYEVIPFSVIPVEEIGLLETFIVRPPS
ncbi:hypothetical protein FBUS_09500 [Fasciolopsis buskii]|uniref:adenylate cyclase n=1 Tax=Fasciolopsis buskii TaxID=27845 RepID=A0A8E0VFX5_9TREM|nr:hypothetical protein FBUS_09500 [Fasciolopsis buski]